MNDSNLDVVAVSEEKLEPPKTLPAPGAPASKPKLKVGDEVYVMKFSYKYPWKTGVVERTVREKGVCMCLVVRINCNVVIKKDFNF